MEFMIAQAGLLVGADKCHEAWVCVNLDTKKTVESVQISELDINCFYSDMQKEI